MDTTVRFTSSVANIVASYGWPALIGVPFFGGLFYYLQLFGSTLLGAVASAGLALITLGLVLAIEALKYLFKRTEAVIVSENGIAIFQRGNQWRYRWEAFSDIRYMGEGWRLEVEGRTIKIWEYGFQDDDWDHLSACLNAAFFYAIPAENLSGLELNDKPAREQQPDPFARDGEPPRPAPVEHAVFTPKYGAGTVLMYLFCGVVLAFILPNVVQDPWGVPIQTTVGVAIIVALATFTLRLIRRVEFTPHTFRVVYYLRPSKEIAYGEVIDMSGYGFRTREDKINTRMMRNGKTFIRLIDDRMQAGQLSGDMLLSSYYQAIAFWIVFVPAIIITFTVPAAFDVEPRWLFPRVLGALIPLSVLAYYGVKGYYENGFASRDSSP